MSIYTEFQLYRIQQLSISKTVLVWPRAKTQPPASLDKVECGLFRGRGAVEAGRKELLERRDGGL